MKKKFSTSWKSSKQKRKQRKYSFEMPYHLKHKALSSNLSMDLRKRYSTRNFPLRKGDTVKVIKGSFKGKQGKVTGIEEKRNRAYVENLQISKKDGSKINFPFKPFSLQIIELDLEWFFEQDHYLSYAQKYLCNIAIITPYLWAIDQIDDCLILGGDAPHITKLNPITFFPPLLGQTSVERMFNANNRTGIPNFLTHSLSSMCFGLQLWQQALLGVTCSVPFPRWAYAITKHKMYTTGGFDTLQIKPKYSSAFALLADLNMRQYDSKLTSIMPHCYSNIIPCESMIRCINQAQ